MLRKEKKKKRKHTKGPIKATKEKELREVIMLAVSGYSSAIRNTQILWAQVTIKCIWK